MLFTFVLCATAAFASGTSLAQTEAEPFPDAKSIWESQKKPIAPKIGKHPQLPAAHAQQPLSLPETYAPTSSAPESISPRDQIQPETTSPATILPVSSTLSSSEQSAADKLQTVSSAESGSLPLRKPGENNKVEKTEAEKGKRRLGSTTQQFSTTMIVLGGIIVVILIGARLMKKHTSVGTMNLSSEVLEVLGRKMLDQRHAIHYVRCGNKILILGSSAEGLRTLSEITDPVEIDRIRGECQPLPAETPFSRSFSFLLSKSDRNSQQVDLDVQHRNREQKRKKSKRRRSTQNQQPAPDLADFRLAMGADQEGKS